MWYWRGEGILRYESGRTEECKCKNITNMFRHIENNAIGFCVNEAETWNSFKRELLFFNGSSSPCNALASYSVP
jgi:hypothetical protein